MNFDDGDCCLESRYCALSCVDCTCHTDSNGAYGIIFYKIVNAFKDKNLLTGMNRVLVFPYNYICNDECNVPEFDYDGGDCCLPNNGGLAFLYCQDCNCIVSNS